MLKRRQIELIHLMLANPFATDIKLSEATGITRATICKWKKNPEFQSYLKECVEKQWADAVVSAQAKMIELADKGNFQANKFILNCNGYNDNLQRVDLFSDTDSITLTISNEDKSKSD